jgi:hypothetical protein
MRAHTLFAMIATTALLTAGCGSSGSENTAAAASATPSSQHSNHHDMSGMSMTDMDPGDKPSQPARMICSIEIREAVQRTFVLSHRPSPTHSWSSPSRVFTCVYRVSSQPLRLSVNDASDHATGRAYFDRLRSTLPGATRIRGIENFGFPAFQTADGDVVIIKDGKTLRVDATRLTRASLPKDFSRAEVAYSIAAAVVACWTE